MPVILHCDQCGKKLRAPDAAAGKRVKCPCGAKLAVPAPVTVEPAELDDLSALSDGASVAQKCCPGCGSTLLAEAVLCTACGYNIQTGARLTMAVSEESALTAEAAQRAASTVAAKKPKPRKTRDPAAGSFNFKPLIILAIVGLMGYGGYYVYRQQADWDPQKIGDEKLKTIAPGMTLAQVVDKMGLPNAVYRYPTGQGQDTGLTMGVPVKAVYSTDFLNAYKGKLSEGFFLLYRFSAAGAYQLHFDPEGTLAIVENAPNLLSG